MSAISIKDYDEIMAVINQYFKGNNTSGEEIKKAFHPNATMNAQPIQTLFEAIDKLAPGEAVGRADILDVSGDIASVRCILENCYGKKYVDFLLLLKTGNEWKIVSKLYQEV